MVARKIYAYCKDTFRFFQRSLWNVILTSRDANIKSRGLPISASRDPKAPLQRSKLIVAEIEGLDSIHKLISRKILSKERHMTFDIPLYQPLDVTSHGYINRMRCYINRTR
jgi:hypothetical protein